MEALDTDCTAREIWFITKTNLSAENAAFQNVRNVCEQYHDVKAATT